jgi:hypothetical protein
MRYDTEVKDNVDGSPATLFEMRLAVEPLSAPASPRQRLTADNARAYSCSI